MKHFISSVILFSVVNIAYGQDSTKSCPYKSCPDAKHGLQFQIGSSFTIRNFNDYTFSYRYRPDYNYGFRAGLVTSYLKSDDDIIEQVDSAVSKPPDYYHNYFFKVSLQYLHNLMTYKNFSFILGGGPFISFSNEERKNSYVSPTYVAEQAYKLKSLGFGLDIVAGVEYLLTDNIIVSGEYSVSLSKSNYDVDNLDKSTYFDDPERNFLHTQKGRRNEFGFGGNSVNFGLAVFF